MLPPINVRASAALPGSSHKKARNGALSKNRSLSQSALHSNSPNRKNGSYERSQPAHLNMDTLKLERKGAGRISEGIEKQRYKVSKKLRKSDNAFETKPQTPRDNTSASKNKKEFSTI